MIRCLQGGAPVTLSNGRTLRFHSADYEEDSKVKNILRHREAVTGRPQPCGFVPTLRRIAVLAGAALALGACGETQQTAEELRSKTDAAVDAKGVMTAIRSSVDDQAIKDAAAGAIREELGAVGAVIDEEALVSGIDKAIDGEAVTNAIGQATRNAAGRSAPSAAEPKVAE